MRINKLFNIPNFRDNDFFKDLFDIKSFVIVFTLFSFISIWSSEMVYNRTKKIKHLNTDLKNLKAEYISTRTILMTKSKRSSLIKKAYSFGLIESENPPKVIYVKHED
tara:strand:+ start:1633 stop:1956 length:324 start_codon:yes stop_codon:yes gene_type:complete